MKWTLLVLLLEAAHHRERNSNWDGLDVYLGLAPLKMLSVAHISNALKGHPYKHARTLLDIQDGRGLPAMGNRCIGRPLSGPPRNMDSNLSGTVVSPALREPRQCKLSCGKTIRLALLSLSMSV